MAIKGQITVDELQIIELDADPTISGVSAPLGSIAIYQNGTTAFFYQKTGASNTSWTGVSGGGGSPSYQVDGGYADANYNSTSAVDGGGA